MHIQIRFLRGVSGTSQLGCPPLKTIAAKAVRQLLLITQLNQGGFAKRKMPN